MTETPPQTGRYRLNVGIVLFNADGRVLIGRRADRRGDKIWQFPQGGVDRGEALMAAARRELMEETGVRSVSFLAQAPGFVTYDFPPGFKGAKALKGYRGQRQAWFAFRFEGEDGEIDLGRPPAAEFDAWRWERLEATPDLVADFKREAYLKVVEAFGDLAEPNPAVEPADEEPRGDILMLHAFGCTGAAFDVLAEALRRRGWRPSAPTLGADLRLKSPPLAALAEVELKDYVAEADALARRLAAESGEAPVLLGHAMGALIVQKLLERGLGRAGVLIAPAPPADLGVRPMLRRALTHANLLFPGALGRRPVRVWRPGVRWGYLNRATAERRARALAQTAFDSPRVFRDLVWPAKASGRAGRVDERAVQAPILTIGAGLDRASPPSFARALDQKYKASGGELILYPRSGHWLIDEPVTETLARDIDAWLAKAAP